MSAAPLLVLCLALSGAAVAQLLLLATNAAVRARVRAALRRLSRGARLGGVAAGLASAGRRAWRLVERRGRERERRIERGRCLDELPELIDVVALGLSAGMSFDAALGVYCEHYRTSLSAHMGEAMRSWQLGVKSRQEALRQLAAQIQVDAFSAFVGTVTESLAFGAPLVETLVEQAEAVREARRADQEEAIEKTPVKMLIPTGVLTLPAMLIAILGPLFASFLSSG